VAGVKMPAAPPGFVQIVGVGGDEQRETSATQEFSLLCGYAMGHFSFATNASARI
jgi:hypothetical protein